MKKVLLMVLALAMLVSITACGGTDTPAPSQGSDSASTSGSGDSNDSTPAANPMQLRISTGYADNHTVTKGIKYFIDYVEDATNGEITFELYTNGTFCSLAEEPSYVSSGATDIGFVMPIMMIEQVPLANFWGQSHRGYDDAVALANHFYLENPETRDEVQREAENYNLKWVNFFPFSCTAPVGSKPLAGWDDMRNQVFGIAVWGSVFERMGISTVSYAVTDTYENLSKGVVDCCSAGLTSAVDMALYEIAPYVLVTDIVNTAPHMIVNLDTWNKMTAEQQAIIEEAAEAAKQYELEIYKSEGDTAIRFLEEQGCTINYMSAEDEAEFITYFYEEFYKTVAPYAEAVGATQVMKDAGSQINEFLEINAQYG